MSKTIMAVFLAALVGCGGKSAETGADPMELYPEEVPLQAQLFAGQSVPVLPITLVLPDSSLAAGELFRRRDVLLPWTDSIIVEHLASRAPEVLWVFPDELRRIARRNPGVAPDPDRMGQSVMRADIDKVPDPFRANLRTLVALTDARLAFIPAALVFRQPEPGVVEAQLMAVMVDARRGTVMWRSLFVARGGTPAQALSNALAETLPLERIAP